MKRIKDMLASTRGWCPYSKAKRLYELVLENKPHRIVEIGVYGGQSLFPMAYACRELDNPLEIFEIYGIDPWSMEEAEKQGSVDDNTRNLGFDKIFSDLYSKILQDKFDDLITLVKATSEEAAGVLFDDPDTTIDFLHIDGRHDTPAVVQDLTLWLPKLTKQAIIVIDDYNWGSVKTGVDQFPQLKLVELHPTWAIFRVEGE